MLDALTLIKELWLNHRWVFYAGVGFYVYLCAAQALPKPDPANAKFYRWFYGFIQGLAGNWGLILKTIQDRRWAKLLEGETEKRNG